MPLGSQATKSQQKVPVDTVGLKKRLNKTVDELVEVEVDRNSSKYPRVVKALSHVADSLLVKGMAQKDSLDKARKGKKP